MSILLSCNQGHVLYQSDDAKDLVVEDILKRIHDDLHPSQRAFVTDSSTEIIGLSAGYGAGKTRALCAKTVELAC